MASALEKRTDHYEAREHLQTASRRALSGNLPLEELALLLEWFNLSERTRLVALTAGLLLEVAARHEQAGDALLDASAVGEGVQDG